MDILPDETNTSLATLLGWTGLDLTMPHVRALKINGINTNYKNIYSYMREKAPLL